MREIKFMAWDKNNNKMLSWEDLQDGGWDSWPTLYFVITGDSQFVPMQFTDLFDKNGKEIYFGMGGIHEDYGPYYVEDGEYDIGSFRVYGPHITWVRPTTGVTRNILSLMDLQPALRFDMDIYSNPELLQD